MLRDELVSELGQVSGFKYATILEASDLAKISTRTPNAAVASRVLRARFGRSLSPRDFGRANIRFHKSFADGRPEQTHPAIELAKILPGLHSGSMSLETSPIWSLLEAAVYVPVYKSDKAPAGEWYFMPPIVFSWRSAAGSRIRRRLETDFEYLRRHVQSLVQRVRSGEVLTEDDWGTSSAGHLLQLRPKDQEPYTPMRFAELAKNTLAPKQFTVYFTTGFLAALQDGDSRYPFRPARVNSSEVSPTMKADAGLRRWSRLEVEATVDDYLAMLRAELEGKRYNKTEHRKTLLGHLDARTPGAVELKHQNISAILASLDLPYVQGYKPRSNYQKLLAQILGERLAPNSEFMQLIGRFAEEEPPTIEIVDLGSVVEPPPQARSVSEQQRSGALSRLIGVRVDYAERESRNRALGLLGEKFVVEFERMRLTAEGCPKLASRVEHVSVTQGDGLGFDVQSFECDGSPRLVEVKTTGGPKTAPFFVTPNEVAVSRNRASEFCLYRVFDYRRLPRLYLLRGPLDESCSLAPTAFSAFPL